MTDDNKKTSSSAMENCRPLSTNRRLANRKMLPPGDNKTINPEKIENISQWHYTNFVLTLPIRRLTARKTMITLASFFENVRLPTISEVAHALIATLDNDDVSTKHIAAIIARDPALVAKLMRLANSARFGASRSISSVDDAIALTGTAHIRTLALAACFADSFPQLPGLDSKEFWNSSMTCAGYARWLAKGANIDGNDAWLAGMILRLGELLIYEVAPSAFAEIEQLPHLPGARWEREVRLLGLSESEITAELARRWSFPERIVTAIKGASMPMDTPSFSRLAGVVHLASLLADTPDDASDGVDALPGEVVDRLGIDLAWMRSGRPSHESFLAFS